MGSLPPAVSVALVLLAYAALCGWSLWRWRRRGPDASAAAGPLLVGYASQTGTAERIARESALRLQGDAEVVVLPLDRIDERTLQGSRRALFVVSTYGQGEPPDNGVSFMRRSLSHSDDALSTLEYGVLALGNSDYREFCGFGRKVFHALQNRGARPLFDMIRMDRDDPAALRHWQERLHAVLGRGTASETAQQQFESWVLRERRCLNPGSQGEPVFHLRLAPLPPRPAHWQAGDIVEIAPCNDPARVDAFVAELHLDPALPVRLGNERASLGHWLARRRLPAAREERQRLNGLSPADLLDRLPVLSPRKYSIASLPEDGTLDLLVRCHTDAAGQAGIGSGWLTLIAQPGDTLALAIRSNPGFHPPAPSSPLILIGNGTGIAGLRAHLKSRAAAGARENWLIFGERSEACDYFFRDEIERWRGNGHLRRLDLAFSRDEDGAYRYVQDVLEDSIDELRAWVREGAAIYVSGSRQGMAGSVDLVLRRALGEGAVLGLSEQGRYRRDVY